jgi:inhibitor of KinA sporulation pathway (predicted exonuclease)
MKTYGNIINIIDLELTCWEDKAYQREHSEIIEVGICQVDLINKKIIKQKNWLVKPKNSSVSDFCENLTGISQKMVDEGTTLQKVSKEIRRNFAPSKYAIGCWGVGDVSKLREECLSLNAIDPFERSVEYNLSQLYAFFNNISGKFSLEEAINRENVILKDQHRALPDAIATAEVFLSMIKKYQRS